MVLKIAYNLCIIIENKKTFFFPPKRIQGKILEKEKIQTNRLVISE